MLRSLSSLRRIPLVARSNPSRKLSSFPDKGQVSSWTKERTTSWLSNVQPLEEDDKQVWNSLRMDGKSLPLVTPDLLVKCGMAAGPALNIVSHIQKLLGYSKINMQSAAESRPNDIPQTLDAKSLHDFIINHPTQLQQFFKQDFSVSTKLANNKAEFSRVGRQDAFRDTYAAMANRLQLRAAKPKMAKERQNNPLPATTATTGGGKSFFLDEIGSLCEEDLQLCDDPAMREVLKHTVAVAITFNGGFPITESIDNNPDRRSLGLAVRALYSYFFKTEKLDFGDFVRALKPVFHMDLDLSLAVRCIAAHSGKGVLLLVDELMKTARCEKNNSYNIVAQLGICLDAFPSEKFNVIVTTLNMGAFAFETSSGRRISWIKLQHAKLTDAKSLFGEDADRYPVLALCIADCNGHFRSLETLKVLWDKPKSKHWNYSQLIMALGDELEEKYSALEIPHIQAALLGAPVKLNAMVPGLKHTFAEYLEMGFFLNTPGKSSSMAKHDTKDTPREFVPRVSPLQLLLFANNHAGDPIDSEEYLYSRAISSLLKLEPNFTWQQYEQFHAHWEVLIRLIRGGTRQSMRKLYGGGTLTSKDPTLYLSRKSHELYSWTTHFPQKYSKNATLPTFPEGALTQHIIIPGVNNPGFDIVAFEENPTAKSEPIVVCIECRFSDPTSATSLDKATVAEKREKTVKQFRPYLEEGKQLDGLSIKESNLFLVVCAFREVNDNAFEGLPANTIVLNRDMLKKLYSPSLASRPQFLLPLKKGESTQVPE